MSAEPRNGAVVTTTPVGRWERSLGRITLYMSVVTYISLIQGDMPAQQLGILAITTIVLIAVVLIRQDRRLKRDRRQNPY